MPTLETDRFRLRAYREADRSFFVRLVTDADLMCRVGGIARLPDRLFERLLAHAPQSGELAWAITWRGSGDLAGHIWLNGLLAESTAQIGFVIDGPFSGRGVATEAARAVARYGLTTLGLPVIEATVDADHTASQRVLEKIGMRLCRQERDEAGAYLAYTTRHARVIDDTRLEITAHRFCGGNEQLVRASETCGCFYCRRIFPAADVNTFVTEAGTRKRCALCPHCMIDSVIPSASGVPITQELMNRMHQQWFSS